MRSFNKYLQLTYFEWHGALTDNFLMNFGHFKDLMQFALDLPCFLKSAFLHDFEVLHAICLENHLFCKSFKKNTSWIVFYLSILPPKVVG